MSTLELKGWTHVHTWQENHGECEHLIYQKNLDPTPWGGVWTDRRVELLTVIKYRDPMKVDGILFRNDPLANDYLLARSLRNNPETISVRSEIVSRCCTSGYLDVKFGEHLFRIMSAAGHGEWAFEIDPEDLSTTPP